MTTPPPKQLRPINHGRIRPVFNRLDDEQKSVVQEFWVREGVVPRGPESEARTGQVVCLYYDKAGAVAGVNTAYPMFIPSLLQTYYAYRLFIRATERKPGVARLMTIQAYQTLRAADVDNKPVGILIQAENAKLMRPGVAAKFAQYGLQRLDARNRKQQIWLIPF